MQLNPKSTALIVIDLQKAVVARDVQPYTSAQVIEKSATLAKAFRDKGGHVVYVNVNPADFVINPTDAPMRDPNAPPPPPDAAEIVPESGIQEGDLRVTKRYWGAFIGTDLEAKLRERNVDTVAVIGIATNMGVESTAREAAALGFAPVLIEDATAGLSAEAHRFAYETIFPRLGRVRTAEQVIEALG